MCALVCQPGFVSRILHSPIPKFFGVFSRRGLVVFFVEDFLPRGAAAGFFPVDFLGGY